MIIKLRRKEEPVEVDRITIIIGDDRYYLKESFGNIEITKASDTNQEHIIVLPRMSNQIEIK